MWCSLFPTCEFMPGVRNISMPKGYQHKRPQPTRQNKASLHPIFSLQLPKDLRSVVMAPDPRLDRDSRCRANADKGAQIKIK
ncbi:hypothetical protein WN944_002797 [Citrus x changshan-huyou]|uniref:Uncharacterized protein n=1 Tax=Citrus x changshan-huyou TaxID=2935761 RepID=A0AAP0MH81_9ROSI